MIEVMERYSIEKPGQQDRESAGVPCRKSIQI